MRSSFFMCSLLGAIFAATTTGWAECGKGKVPAWGDVETIRYERTNCYGKCPSYEVLFGKLPTNSYSCYYVGRQYVVRHGTYKGECSLTTFQKVIRVLEQNDFYSLNYDSSVIVMDTPHDILAVERCGVTTKLDWPGLGRRDDIEALFRELDAIVNGISWRKESASVDSPEPLMR